MSAGQNVSVGGIYDIPKVSYSESTKLLIKDLLRESSVSHQHQRYIERWVGNGGKLPNQNAISPPTQQQATTIDQQHTTRTPHFQTKRSHNVIKKMGLYEPNTHYVPPPPKYGPGSKERCQDLMSYGREGIQPKIIKSKTALDSPPPTDRFNEIVGEMDERVTWLKAMEAVGAGDQYRDLINTQLAIRLRDLEFIDQERATDIAKIYRNNMKKN